MPGWVYINIKNQDKEGKRKASQSLGYFRLFLL